ncbi:uncharacterized protein [Littorina saxatilis]|uniref:Uncharacterized protein n=1 Tax=Littorina saxatilis TaxID=31220 RepID=A0AAN9GEQ9_9CAEN
MPSVFGAASIPFIGCVALLAAEIMTILAFATPYWASDDDMSFGLWRTAKCNPGSTGPDRDDCYRSDFPWKGADWQHATRGLESLAIIFFSFPLIVLPVYIYVALGLYYRCLMGCMALSVLLGTLCNIAGVVIYGIQIGSNDTWKLGWCLIVCIIGGGLGLIAFIILLIATINKPTFTPEKYFLSGFYVEQDRNRLYVVETDEPTKVVYAASEPPMSARPPLTPLPQQPLPQQPMPQQPMPAPMVIVSEDGGRDNPGLEPFAEY